MKRVDSARSWMSEVHCLVNTYKFSNMPQNWNNFNNRKQKGIDVLFLICFEKFLVSNFFYQRLLWLSSARLKIDGDPYFFSEFLTFTNLNNNYIIFKLKTKT